MNEYHNPLTDIQNICFCKVFVVAAVVIAKLDYCSTYSVCRKIEEEGAAREEDEATITTETVERIFSRLLDQS